MDKMLEELITLADILDTKGFSKIADDIDEVIKQRWESLQQNPPPPSGGKLCDTKWKDAFEYLKNSLVAMQESGSLEMSKETIPQLMKAIELVSMELDQKCQKSGLQSRIEGADETYYVPHEFVTLAENIANLSEDARKGEERLQSEELSEEDRRIVQTEVSDDRKKLEENEAVLKNKATPEQYSAVMAYVNSISTGRKVVLVPERRQTEERRQQ